MAGVSAPANVNPVVAKVKIPMKKIRFIQAPLRDHSVQKIKCRGIVK